MENLFIEHFLSYEDFRSNKEIQALELNEEDLKAIYQVIDQNRFLLCSEHYLPILFQSIMKKTSVATSLKLKSLFQNHHFNISKFLIFQHIYFFFIRSFTINIRCF